MERRILIFSLLVASSFASSCSLSMLYPAAGAVAGGATGAIVGGPPGAGVGAGLGYGSGKIAQLTSDNKELVQAMNEGDVQGIVASQLEEHKGWYDETLDNLYGILKLCCIGVILWNVIPIIYTRYVHKKANKNGKNEES